MTDLQAVHAEAIQHYNNGQFASAIPLFDQILAERPDLAGQVNLSKGACLFQTGDYDAAVTAFDSVIASNDEAVKADAYLNRGKALERMDKFGDAADSYSNAVSMKPEHAAAWGDIAHCYNAAKQYEQALDAAAKGLEASPATYMKLRNERIFALFKLERPMESVAEVEAILEQNSLGALKPEQIELYSNILTEKANELQNAGDFPGALVYLEMVNNGNQTPNSLYQLGLCHLRGGNDKEAVDFLEKAVAGDGANWKYRVGLGTACMRPSIADYEKAATHLGEAYTNPALGDAKPSVAFNYALALMRVGRDAEAKGPLEFVYEKDKGNWIASALLGTVLVTEKEFAPAIPVLINAIEASNGAADDSVYYNLGYAYLMLGMFKEAEDAFKQALAKNPNNEMAQNAFEQASAAVKEQEEEERRVEAEKEAERQRQIQAEKEAAEMVAREKAAKDAAAKQKIAAEKAAKEQARKEAEAAAEEQRRFKIQEARERRERRIKAMEAKFGPAANSRTRLRRPSLDLIPTGNTRKGAEGYVSWYNDKMATE